MGPTVWSVLSQRWSETKPRKGTARAIREIAADLWEFLVESTPERRRRRYGDVEYDWDHAVDTTSATVSHRTRLIAALSGAPYQPTEPTIFREMIEALQLDVSKFTFIDLGSGKGRSLFLAAEFPFQRIIGVELVPELHQVAEKNVRARSMEGKIELLCDDARSFEFPLEPIVLYLFNPLPAPALAGVLQKLRTSTENSPRPVRVVYHNPLSEHVMSESGFLRKTGGTSQYSIYSN